MRVTASASSQFSRKLDGYMIESTSRDAERVAFAADVRRIFKDVSATNRIRPNLWIDGYPGAQCPKPQGPTPEARPQECTERAGALILRLRCRNHTVLRDMVQIATGPEGYCLGIYLGRVIQAVQSERLPSGTCFKPPDGGRRSIQNDIFRGAGHWTVLSAAGSVDIYYEKTQKYTSCDPSYSEESRSVVVAKTPWN